MEIGTGITCYHQIVSVDRDNNPLPSATFDYTIYKNGSIDTGTTLNFSLMDASRGVFSAYFSASTIGSYQIYAKNDITDVIFVSGIVKVLPDVDRNIYIGL